MIQNYDHQGASGQEAVRREMWVQCSSFDVISFSLTNNHRSSLIQNLVKLSESAPSVHVDIPPEVTSYVEGSRNPDIFTREFVETVQRMNQMLKGRADAYLLMRDTLAKDIISAIPELREDVRESVESTGGTIGV